ncbi:hypothetical protein [Lysinibacter cavernae]|uniref:Uncharacterized protein n=1 Tax=Lysinibacter cavernae TaxID=1640652 RepID=A0A7X5QYX6_9MICO|nr:hypothetical protein [Lysinibacter cavernae]NIH52574.1 hypothetical protein [Lysinibacter cavernae]
MSYDLYFWRQDDSITDTPSALLDRLWTGHVAGVSELDLSTLQSSVLGSLQGFAVESHTPIQIMLQRQSGGAFDLGWSSQLVSVSAYGDVTGDDWNTIIDVMNAAGMAVYDPQTDERFFQPELP